MSIIIFQFTPILERCGKNHDDCTSKPSERCGSIAPYGYSQNVHSCNRRVAYGRLLFVWKYAILLLQTFSWISWENANFLRNGVLFCLKRTGRCRKSSCRDLRFPGRCALWRGRPLCPLDCTMSTGRAALRKAACWAQCCCCTTGLAGPLPSSRRCWTSAAIFWP